MHCHFLVCIAEHVRLLGDDAAAHEPDTVGELPVCTPPASRSCDVPSNDTQCHQFSLLAVCVTFISTQGCSLLSCCCLHCCFRVLAEQQLHMKPQLLTILTKTFP
jgi:hypothetical protein